MSNATKAIPATSAPVHIIGAGLAGSEAAYFLAERGVSVFLHEMRPQVMTPAHTTPWFAELVCSNSFKSQNPCSATGMLKTELNRMNSIVLRSACQNAIPGGEALVVDRTLFSETITHILKSHSSITVISGEVKEPVTNAINLIATGPLTSEPLCQWLMQKTHLENLYFYDAISPIIDAKTIDTAKVFLANRYQKGDEKAYLNCPLNKKEYYDFVNALLTAEKVPAERFEEAKFFQGCQPIEVIAASGKDSLRFSAMKPVGLIDPVTNSVPFAVIQLRPENISNTAYSLVSFQTKLKYREQERIFRMIPALQNAEFLRLGSIHRNTYVCGPNVLAPNLSIKGHPDVFLAGQLTGVEGYLESAACGLLAGIFIYQKLHSLPHFAPPANTVLGALLRHVTGSDEKTYMPTNIHFGLLESFLFENLTKLKKNELRMQISQQAIAYFDKWREDFLKFC
ncbi:MAG: methylenetetrahydrofolate--tRNA-(uracil(54)-C(5))-methyltransferase (FADH(2)-oxidizing) TrmFO [Bdellovibrio sp.]|nr:methylenetetrahydrofolate--tRNA-(uracil(54)-C(5))-methyltransferase (FADH(2)-oxidizing) TrmFO [Bdellovibrio sp.]